MMQKLIDAIRHVTAKVQKAIDEGYRSRMIDADDLVEVMLAIADELESAGAARPNHGGRRNVPEEPGHPFRTDNADSFLRGAADGEESD